MDKRKQLNANIGVRIKVSREQAGMTQEQLAERINRSTQFVSTIERGVAGPSIETIISICDALSTTSEWLIRGIRNVPTAATITEKLSRLSPMQLAVVDRMMDNLLELLEAENETARG